VCGIAGFCRFDVGVDVHRDHLAEAVARLGHRGPDDHGLWFGETAGLGHRRLSILDVSSGGHQPMASPGGRFVMVFNGEIYNFQELKSDLEARGLRFRSTGDSEVILGAFETWGIEASVRRFVGMFAIAVWDRAERRLVLLRDRLGVKPLFYGWDGRCLWFGSELKSLRAFTHWTPEIDRTALAEYFRYGYINAPRTIYAGVSKLLPGHWLELGESGGPVVHRYWNVLDALGRPLSGTEEELTDQLEALMVDAFRLRMVSDVPVGMFLSGGIDSSVVTALLQRHHGGVKTFTIGFAEDEFDEAPHARAVAEHLGTDHTERTLETSEAKRTLPRWAELYDEPFADSSGIPTYLVSKVAAERVKVVLSADGGDELFSGYNLYTSMLRNAERRDSLPAPLRAAVGAGLSLMPLEAMDNWLASRRGLPRSWRGRRRPTYRLCRIRDWVGAAEDGVMYDTAWGNAWWGDTSVRLAGGTNHVRELADAYPGSFAEKMCLWDLHNYLPGDILAKVDRATMAASIEGREPLIDHRLVEFAFRLPLSMRRGPLGPKHLLRKILYRHVPRELVDRPKMGFGIPLADWLRGDLRYLVDQHLDPQAIRRQGILDPAAVEKAVSAFRLNDDHAINRVWSVLAFQLWHERWA
jgi:asparagine synthase (glutamine-hydrolysing)